MKNTIKKLLIPLALLIILGFVVTVANQTAQLVSLADRASPTLGAAMFWILMVGYGFCLLVPIYAWFRLPSALRPPPSDADPDFERHVQRLGARLQKNPALEGVPTHSREEIEAALPRLDALADARMKMAAKQVFITTAISQNGSLDTFLVLAAQSKLVLEIARTYHQRPSLRDLSFLYANVAATAFVAGELEDVDLAAQLQPVLAAAFGSAAGAVPGLGTATTLFVNSVTTGGANAFLTLRVGVITSQYCRALVLPERSALRRSSMVRATGLLGSVVLDGTRIVAASVGTATRRTIGVAFESFGDQIRNAAAGARTTGAAVLGKLPFGRLEAEPLAEDQP